LYLHSISFRTFLMILLCFTATAGLQAQVMNNPNGIDPNASLFDQSKAADSATKARANSEWKEEKAVIYYNYLNSAKSHSIDSSMENFHRYQRIQPWWGKDLGNEGTAVRNQFFTPFLPNGLSLGYHIYDMYQRTLDSLPLFNTTRPYSSFRYLLGSKTLQDAAILHTQNINPFWNFAFDLGFKSSAGFYKLQQATRAFGAASTNYQSPNKRYYLAIGFVYNRFRQGENGGLQSTDSLSSPNFSNRQLLPVNLPALSTNASKPAVTNTYRNYDFYVQNNYSFGITDTVYTKDSTGMSIQFTPRFRIKHQLQLHSERHIFKDLRPDSTRYLPYGNISFATTDSVFGQQDWFYVDNKFSLNGFIGKLKELVEVEAGIANRLDYFKTSYVSGTDKLSSIGNYLFGQIKKEAFQKGQWEYQADANLFLTGDAVGNFNLSASVGKDLGKWGQFYGGFRQNLSNAPYAYTNFKTNHYEVSTPSLNKMSATQLWAKTHLPGIDVELGINNTLLANYMYYGANQRVQQQSDPFSVLQVYGRKEFRLGIFRLDNELAWQKATSDDPVHLPVLLIREKIGVVTPMFKSALIVAAGLEARYHTRYYSDGYTPYFNQFYWQNSTPISNVPEVLAYFNFKIKTFRAFVMFDQLQQLVTDNIINAPGYPAQNMMFRFGFNWVLIN